MQSAKVQWELGFSLESMLGKLSHVADLHIKGTFDTILDS